MNRTWITAAQANVPVKIEGFLERIRNTRTMAFLVVRDRSGSLQVTIEKERHPEWADLLDQLTPESVVHSPELFRKTRRSSSAGAS